MYPGFVATFALLVYFDPLLSLSHIICIVILILVLSVLYGMVPIGLELGNSCMRNPQTWF